MYIVHVHYKRIRTSTGRVKNKDRKRHDIKSTCRQEQEKAREGLLGKNKDNIKHRQDKARDKGEEEGKVQEGGQGKGQGQGQGTGTRKITRNRNKENNKEQEQGKEQE